MPPRSDRIAALSALLLAALPSCSDQKTNSTVTGDLWPYRDRIAEALTLRTGTLAATMRKPVRLCHAAWASTGPSQPRLDRVDCDRYGQELRSRLIPVVGFEPKADALNDPKLWSYVLKQAGI
jgi:hypothetical protein